MMMTMYIPTKSQKLHTNNMEGDGMDKISDEILEAAIQTQEEFIRRYRNRYKEEPEFDLVILAIMKELKEKRASERSANI